jgi:hypothetical protein
MKLAKFKQTSFEVLRRSLDYSQWLAAGEVLTGVTFVVTDTTSPALVIPSNVLSNTGVVFFASGGLSGFEYTVTVSVTTSQGQTKEDYFHLKIQDDDMTVLGQSEATPTLLAQVTAEAVAAAASAAAAAASAAQAAAYVAGGSSVTTAIANAAVRYDVVQSLTGGQQAQARSNISLAAVAASGSAGDLGTGTLPAARMPNPAPTTLGGIKSNNGNSHQWVAAINTDGTVTLSQPGFSDISGVVSAAQIPAPTLSTLGGMKAISPVSHQWINQLDTSGVPHLSQPAFSDISGTATTGQMPANVAYLNAIQTFAANQQFNAAAIFGSGAPWYDITSSVFGAVAGGPDCTTAIQAAINAADNSSFGGGIVFVPPGLFTVSGQLTVNKSTRIVGCGRNVSILNGSATDSGVLLFTGTSNWSGAQDLGVWGYFNAASGTNVIAVQNPNIHTTLTRVNAFGGYSALYSLGVDNLYEDCSFCAFNTHVVTNGANNYIRCQMDDGIFAHSATWGLVIGSYYTTGVQENTFVACDLSSIGGGFGSGALDISGGGTSTMTKFMDTVIGGAVVINTAKWTAFSNCEFGVNNVNTGANPTSFSNCYGTNGAIAVTGSAKHIGASCVNIT